MSYGIDISAYCFMPDHLHALVTATAETADLAQFVRHAKQTSGHAYLQATGRPLWQPGYFERVLRSGEDPLRLIAYMVANPLRAGLTAEANAYPFWDAPGYTRTDVLDAIAGMSTRRA